MSEEKEKKKGISEAEEVKEILGVVSTEIPSLIKGIIASVFSEEAGKNMGRAAASFYKELKESGIPENVAVKMTEEYIGVFTSLGDVLKSFTRGKKKWISPEKGEEIGREIEKKIKEKMAEKFGEEWEEEEE
ncbi:MAG: hypothetical protein U9O89_04620 [Thermoproteota archaeon]|nr:hypothetical protein [Thermoproteota archaeon]